MLVTVIGRGHSGTRAMSQTLSESGVYMGEPLNTSWDLLPRRICMKHAGFSANMSDTQVT